MNVIGFPVCDNGLCNISGHVMCIEQTKVETGGTKGLLQPIAMAAIPWTDIAMDFLTELPIILGKSTVLVVIDRFSKMLRLITLGKQIDTESV